MANLMSQDVLCATTATEPKRAPVIIFRIGLNNSYLKYNVNADQ